MEVWFRTRDSVPRAIKGEFIPQPVGKFGHVSIYQISQKEGKVRLVIGDGGEVGQVGVHIEFR